MRKFGQPQKFAYEARKAFDFLAVLFILGQAITARIAHNMERKLSGIRPATEVKDEQ